MPETLNTEGPESPGGSSSTPQGEGDLISTVDLAMSGAPTPAEAKKTDDGDLKGEEGEKPEEEKGKETLVEEKKGEKKEVKPEEEKKATSPEKGKEKPEEKKGEETRFDQHPRWKQIIKERDDARIAQARLEGRLGAIEKQGEQAGKGKGELSYKNILDMSNREIREVLSEEDGDAKGLLADFGRQIHAEILEEVSGKLFTQEQVDDRINEALARTDSTKRIEAGYEQFAKDNPGFDEMWASGELQEHTEANPWHTPISAYLMLTKGKEDTEAKEKAEKDVQDRIDAAIKETENRVRTEVQAKGGARVLGEGPSAVRKGGELNPRLKDTKKYGGTIKALTDELIDDAQITGG